jgi:hypothetical protein
MSHLNEDDVIKSGCMNIWLANQAISLTIGRCGCSGMRCRALKSSVVADSKRGNLTSGSLVPQAALGEPAFCCLLLLLFAAHAQPASV